MLAHDRRVCCTVSAGGVAAFIGGVGVLTGVAGGGGKAILAGVAGSDGNAVLAGAAGSGGNVLVTGAVSSLGLPSPS